MVKEKEQVPTAVALVNETSRQPFCSGTILTKHRIITAAHCLEKFNGDYKDLRIVAGTADLSLYYRQEKGFYQVHEVKSASFHSHYDKKNIQFDLAIIHLKTKINFNVDTIKAAVLPPPELKYEGREIKVGGWGQLSAYGGQPAFHRVINIEIHPNERCKERFGDFDERQMFCGGDRQHTACKGDSGGGAIHEFGSKSILFGVVSFGYKDDDLHSSCRKETTFQKISASLPWIYRETKLK